MKLSEIACGLPKTFSGPRTKSSSDRSYPIVIDRALPTVLLNKHRESKRDSDTFRAEHDY